MSFPSKISKVVCIGRNYADHALELGNKLPSKPFFFVKPPSAVLARGAGPVLRPKGVELHYELELGVIIGKRLRDIDPDNFTFEEAEKYISGYTLGLDLTARNLQQEAKEKGLPWSIAKGFDTFCPLGDFIPKSQVPDPHHAWLKFSVNNEIRQNDSTELMTFKIPQLLAFISNVMTLEEGDVVLTGTPKGVGEIVPGDKLHGELLVNDVVVGTIDNTVENR